MYQKITAVQNKKRMKIFKIIWCVGGVIVKKIVCIIGIVVIIFICTFATIALTKPLRKGFERIIEEIIPEKKEVHDINKYGKYEGVFYTDIVMFPKNIDNKKVVEYKYVYKHSLFFDDQYIALKYCWDSQYEDEKKRLSNLSSENYRVKYDKKILGRPAYILEHYDGDLSQYALIDDENKTIVYVYVQYAFSFKKEKYIFENH